MTKYFCTCVLLSIAFASTGQDAVFSQFYASGISLNPALASRDISSNISVNSRSQWSSLSDAYLTNQLSAILPLKTDRFTDLNRGAVGLSIVNDQMQSGSFSNLSTLFTLAYNILLSTNTSLTLGINGGFTQKKINPDNFQWNSQYNPEIGFEDGLIGETSGYSNQILIPEVASGIMLNHSYKKESEIKRGSFLGISAYHLTTPNEAFFDGNVQKLAMRLNLHGGFDIGVGEKITVSPNALLVTQNNRFQINTGTYFKYSLNNEGHTGSHVLLGIWYRLQDAYIAMAGYGGNYFSVGLSYDYNSSTLQTFSRGRGAYEVFLKLQKPPKKQARFYSPRI